MDTENTENGYRSSTAPEGTAGKESQLSGTQDILSCLPLPPPVCQALRKLRAPALCMTCHLEGHIIPDLDVARQASQTAGGQSGSQNGNQSGNQSGNQGGNQNGNPNGSQSTSQKGNQNSNPSTGQAGGRSTCSGGNQSATASCGCFPNRMQDEKHITVRLFDLGLCAAGIMLATCMAKCFCGCAQGMKYLCRKLW